MKINDLIPATEDVILDLDSIRGGNNLDGDKCDKFGILVCVVGDTTGKDPEMDNTDSDSSCMSIF